VKVRSLPIRRLFDSSPRRHPRKGGAAVRTFKRAGWLASVPGGWRAAPAQALTAVRGGGAEIAEGGARLSGPRDYPAALAVILSCVGSAFAIGGLSFPPRRSRC